LALRKTPFAFSKSSAAAGSHPSDRLSEMNQRSRVRIVFHRPMVSIEIVPNTVRLLSQEIHRARASNAWRAHQFLSSLIPEGNVRTLCFLTGTARLAGMTLAHVAAGRNTSAAVWSSNLLPTGFGHNNDMHPIS
jgi:hypothetical protein